jgi:hypothetical protein
MPRLRKPRNLPAGPLPEERRTEHINFRASAADRNSWIRAAKSDGRSLTDWIIRRCNGTSTTSPVRG